MKSYMIDPSIFCENSIYEAHLIVYKDGIKIKFLEPRKSTTIMPRAQSG